MGKDRGRLGNSYERRKPVRDPRKRILIVCEGNTEKKYLESFCREWRLSSVKVIGKGGTPMHVVKDAFDEREKKKENNEEQFDSVWAIFDRDEHSDFRKAIDYAREQDIKAAFSIPCFEYWYLLHFKMTTKQYHLFDNLKHDLEKHLKGYDKSINYFSKLYDKLGVARENAGKVRSHNENNNVFEPSTEVDRLIDALDALRFS